jgi:hypothetical protein
LDAATVIERTSLVTLRIECTYAQLEKVRNTAHSCGGEVQGIAHEGGLSITVSVPKSKVGELTDAWRSQGMHIHLQEPAK